MLPPLLGEGAIQPRLNANTAFVPPNANVLLIATSAAATRRIHIGSGGVMLPNHVPLRVVETYRTLNGLNPGRIDLGIGRAGGSDGRTLSALRSVDGNYFPQELPWHRS